MANSPTAVVAFDDMPRGNPSPKLAITVDPEVHRGILAAAEADGLSVSAWMTKVARKELQIRDGLAAIAEYEAEFGAFTEEELAAADAYVDRLLHPKRSKSDDRE